MSTDMIPFQIDAERIVPLFASQLYQSPLALLRENTQNAFDAIRLRLHEQPNFAPRIDLELRPDLIVITDNGIGMTPGDLRQHYWTAGSSSKNTEAARAAGVVGTFGIGAMANFGIADAITVKTESAITGERTISKAEKSKLSLTENCIELRSVEPKGSPGTKVTTHIAPKSYIDVARARAYITGFVTLVDIPIYVNGDLVSQGSMETAVPIVPETWRHEAQAEQIGRRLRADVTLVISNNAEVRLELANIVWADRAISGRIALRSGLTALRTFRSGFGLATVSVNSAYQFGGVADLLVLEPTAGREAITVDGMQLLQSLMSEIDAYVSALLSDRDECDVSTPFMQWTARHQRTDLMRRLKMSIFPGDRIALGEIEARSRSNPMMLYEGVDQGMIKLHATEESPLLVLARNNPRRNCEKIFIERHCNVESISDMPVVKTRKRREQLTIPESALQYRIEAILDSDYFLKADVVFGAISHNLPILVEKKSDRVLVTLNPEGQTIELLLGLYDTDFGAFGGMAKDFVRTFVFPKVADYVPSSTRQGAEAFLKAIRRQRETFEYADVDLDNLPRIWADYHEGLITVEEAVERSKLAARSSVQIYDAGAAASARDIVYDVIQNERALQEAEPVDAASLEPAPAITRLEVETTAKLLTIGGNEPSLRDYRCFLAITDKARQEMGEFFLQPHRTSIVWGGQRVLFIFIHHSDQFGLYYDLQTREPLEAPAGGGPTITSTIVLKNCIFIPIPNLISASFIPRANERKRFEVRADILRTESLEPEEGA